MKSKLPIDGSPIRLDPDLAKEVEKMLQPYTGVALERAQKAFLERHKQLLSAYFMGNWADLVAQYQEAIDKAVA